MKSEIEYKKEQDRWFYCFNEMEKLRETIQKETALKNIHMVLDELEGCASEYCAVTGTNQFGMGESCECLSWLDGWINRCACEYLEAKRKLL